jgi:hypothetical protein
MICVCTQTGEWGKDDAVLQVDVAYTDGGEECGAHDDLLKTRYEMLGMVDWRDGDPCVVFIAIAN